MKGHKIDLLLQCLLLESGALLCSYKMCGKHMSHNYTAHAIEFHKVWKTNSEIGYLTGVNEKTVSALLKKWLDERCKEVPHHKHGSGHTPKTSEHTFSGGRSFGQMKPPSASVMKVGTKVWCPSLTTALQWLL